MLLLLPWGHLFSVREKRRGFTKKHQINEILAPLRALGEGRRGERGYYGRAREATTTTASLEKNCCRLMKEKGFPSLGFRVGTGGFSLASWIARWKSAEHAMQQR